jgi:hypothetical protein
MTTKLGSHVMVWRLRRRLQTIVECKFLDKAEVRLRSGRLTIAIRSSAGNLRTNDDRIHTYQLEELDPRLLVIEDVMGS